MEKDSILCKISIETNLDMSLVKKAILDYIASRYMEGDIIDDIDTCISLTGDAELNINVEALENSN